MDTFFQVLEDHTFPTRLSDFFAFAHRSALAAEAECPKVNARTPHYSRAVRKAIAGTLLTADSLLIRFRLLCWTNTKKFRSHNLFC